MTTDFSQPQRQSKVGIVIMFFYALQQYARALWPILVIWIFKFDELNKVGLFAGIFGIIGMVALVAYLQYLNFTFYLDDENDEFIISEGIFNKTKTAIQLNKIQQVNINQSLLQRIVGVYALDVDTAGSNKKEGKIRAVSHELALALKSRLLDNEKKVAISESDENSEINNVQTSTVSQEKPFIEISFLSLLKVGITSNYLKTIGLLLAFFITIYENLKNVSGVTDLDQGQFDSYMDQQLALTSILILIAIVLFLILIINVIRVIFKYFNFKIARQNGSLLLSYGLIDTKSTIIKPEKVQITSIKSNYFQKKMNILELKIKQATGGEKEEKKSAIEIPGCNASEKDAVMRLLFGSVPEKGIMLKPNFRKLGFALFLSIVLPLGVFLFLANEIEEISEFAYFIIPYVIFVGLVNYFAFKNNRLFINDKFIIKQSGAWDIENEIIEPKKIQAISTSQLFWHKSLNIGSVTLHTAGGNISFDLGNFETIKQYANLWLYEIETSDSNWM